MVGDDLEGRRVWSSGGGGVRGRTARGGSREDGGGQEDGEQQEVVLAVEEAPRGVCGGSGQEGVV